MGLQSGQLEAFEMFGMTLQDLVANQVTLNQPSAQRPVA